MHTYHVAFFAGCASSKTTFCPMKGAALTFELLLGARVKSTGAAHGTLLGESYSKQRQTPAKTKPRERVLRQQISYLQREKRCFFACVTENNIRRGTSHMTTAVFYRPEKRTQYKIREKRCVCRKGLEGHPCRRKT